MTSTPVLQSPTIASVFFGINPAGLGIYPFGRGINLDLRLCTVPTVGLYRSKANHTHIIYSIFINLRS
jgi:hypothetical protein